ncbi:MAG: EAL domain-containing response regulator [Burkholderiales bacterium]
MTLDPPPRVALVVDDDPVAREVTGALLRRAGFARVDDAVDGRHALERIAVERYGLLVCDLRMPEVDGVELLRHLAARRVDAPIVITSACHERVLASATGLGRAQGLNLVGGLSKPLSPRALHRLLAASDLLTRPPEPESARRLDAAALGAALDLDGIAGFAQPVVRVADGAVVGAELRPRWIHPEHGVLAEDAFLPLAVRAGLASRVTERMVVQALGLRRAIAAEGFTVSVDLAGSDLQDDGVVDRLDALADAFAVPTSDLELQVTEPRLVEASTSGVEVLTRLRMRGFGLAISSFGTGWSSLALLAQVPFDEMRIDARFVLAAPTDEVSRGIVESSVQLAGRLGMTVGADGLQSPSQWLLCRRYGITTVRGAAIGAPVPAPEFALRHPVGAASSGRRVRAA